ncbi:MAG: rod shape-determining protein RodA [Parcubacteria group bacterium]|nr:rod shape-determining protein RodA [Parcubacteria group bacterium]
MQKVWLAFLRCDRVLLVTVFLLVAFGTTALYSVQLGLGGEEQSLVVKQVLFFVAGLGLLTFFMTVDYRLWQPFYPWFYVASIVLLLLLFTPLGEVIRGVRSWLDFGVFVWQPVELIKVLLIICLGGYFSKQGRHLRTGKPLIVSGLAVTILVGITLLQPDLGSAGMLFLLWLGLVLLLGLSRWQIALMSMLFVGVALLGWSFALQPYQRNRVLTFLDPGRDPLGDGYNLTQSIIAIGSGNWMGRGIGFGSQSQLRFLPESQSDFIFAVIGEELGLAGVVILLVLYGLLAWRLLVIAQTTRSDFGQIICVGVAIAIVGQAAVHVGMNMGLLPVTGLPLPFISSGGSYLLAVMSMVGLAQSVAVHST